MCSFSYVLPTPPAECRGWSGQSGRSIVVQNTFSEFLGRVWGASCVFRPAYTSRSAPGLWSGQSVWTIGTLVCGTELSFFHVLFFFDLPIPPRSETGAIWAMANPTMAQDCVTFLGGGFGGIISPRSPR